jgi:ribose transport system permease protein
MTTRGGHVKSLATARARIKAVQLGPWAHRYGTLLGLVAIVVFFAALKPSVFLTGTNFRNIIEQSAILGVIAISETIVMVLGDFDLSVGTLAGLSGVIVLEMMLQGISPTLAIVVTFVVGAAAGALNGYLISYMGLSAFVATLATMTAFQGAALLITGGTALYGIFPAFVRIGQGGIGPIKVPMIVMVVVFVLAYIVLSRTTLGRRWYAIGGNEEASFLSGIKVKRLRFWAFVICGMGATLGGIMLTARLTSAHPQAGVPFMLSALAATFLGMTVFSEEGEANVGGTIVGVLILGVMKNGLDITRVNTYAQQIVTGAVIVVAVLLSGIARRRA